MVSPIILLVPLYGLIAHLHLLDTQKGLVLVYVAVQLPFTIVVLRNFFDALPRSLFEAALLDGATRATTFRRIALPLIGPGLASVAIFNLALYWAEFGLALVLLDSQQRFDDSDWPLQFSERLRNGVAARGRGQLHRPAAGAGGVSRAAAVLRRRPHLGSYQGMTTTVHVISTRTGIASGISRSNNIARASLIWSTPFSIGWRAMSGSRSSTSTARASSSRIISRSVLSVRTRSAAA